jgi:hypothetical protein
VQCRLKKKGNTKMKAFKILENSVVGNCDFYKKNTHYYELDIFLRKITLRVQHKDVGFRRNVPVSCVLWR